VTDEPNNPRAFPVPIRGQLGMTLRDYFAGEAMVGMLSNGQGPDAHWGHDFRQVAGFAYEVADAMLEARNG